MLESYKNFIEARDTLLNAKEYNEAKENFSWPYVEEFNWALDYFDKMAEEASTPAMLYVDDEGVEKSVSFQELKVRSNKIANFLKEEGLVKGDRILLILSNCVELFETFLGAMKLGCTIIPASLLLTTKDIEDRILRGKIKCIITEKETIEKVDAAGNVLESLKCKIVIGDKIGSWKSYYEIDDLSGIFKNNEKFLPTDELLIYFTSGTTAKPKLVLHTHTSYPIGHLTTMYWIGLKRGYLHYNISAPGWAKHAWSSIFAPWNAGATTFVYNYKGKFDPKKILSKIEEYEVDSLCAPPTVWRILLQEDLSRYKLSLKEAVSAGEPLNPEVIEKVRKATNISIREGYGQTETTLQIGTFPGMEVRPGSMGKEAPGFNLGILDNEGRELGVGEEGTIALKVKPLKPIGLMECYLDPYEKNFEVFVNQWYLTGDMAFKDKDGYFWFIGRVDDVFKSSDYRISPFELESELLKHPAIVETAVVASPDKIKGAIPKAYIILKKEYSAGEEIAYEIFKFIKDNIAPYKRPRIIEFVTELPKTVSGKIKRGELRRIESELRASNQRKEHEYFEEDFRKKLG
ncbi:MAG: AMP-binding protein [Nitrososphaeria archaeon]